MPTIYFNAKTPLCQVECPTTVGKGSALRAFARSPGASGAIHVRPSSTRHVTEDELNVLQADSRVGNHITVLAAAGSVEPAPKPPAAGAAPSLPAPPPPAEAGAAPEPVATSEAAAPARKRPRGD